MPWQDLIQPELETGGAYLRLLQVTDREALREIVFDPAIWTYFVTRIETEADLDQFIGAGLTDIAAGRRLVYMVFGKPGGRLAGSMCYGNLAEADLRLEIGWSWLGAAFRGQGINRWAKLALLTQAFDRLGCERVEFKTDILNLPARRGLEKIGAAPEGVFRSYNFMPGGRRRDAIYFSILKSEWPAIEVKLSAPSVLRLAG